MINIEKYLDRFESHMNGELKEEDLLAFDMALEKDADMRRAWKEYKAMMEAFADRELIALREKLNRAFELHFGKGKIRQLYSKTLFKISAAVIILIIIGSLLYNPQWFNDNQVAINTTDSVTVDTTDIHIDTTKKVLPPLIENIEIVNKIKEQQTQIASLYDNEAYQISPVYAELLHSVYRSGWFKLISPADSAIFTSGDILVFRWETNIQSPLYFDVLNRHGHVVYTHPDSIASPWHWAPILEPAIYMFRFATKEEPVWMGAGVVE